ncbi:unnamed protein product [Lampetra planeri]
MAWSGSADSGSQAYNVGSTDQSTSTTSSPADWHCQDQPADTASEVMRPLEGAAIFSTTPGDGVKNEHRQLGTEPSFEQRLPVLTAFSAEGGDWGAFER